ncbi:MAG: hypothetical protein Fur0035_12490 [Anaerolineales bacterium]
MKRNGRLLIILVVLILVLSIAAFFVISNSGGLAGLLGGGQAQQAAPTAQIVIAKQPINRDELLPADALEVIPYPEDKIGPTMFRNIADVADIYYAKFPIGQGVPLTKDMLSLTPFAAPEGSTAAKSIPGGMVAISIPTTRLATVSYAIRPGDHVNVIATNLFVDVDASFQTVLPDYTAVITAPVNVPPNPPVLTLGIASGGAGSVQGRAELDPTLNQAIYLSPSEEQRPRLVSQMILQNIQVLQVGDFTQAAAATDPNAPADQQAAAPAAPDVVTLIVTPQDAISLTYLMYADAKLTMVLRSEGDENIVDILPVTLQFLLSQYNIPLPAKLPYALDPRIDKLPDIGVPPTPLPKQ